MVILAGSIWYTWIKHVESNSPSASIMEKYQRVPTEPKDMTPDLDSADVIVEFDAELEEFEEGRRRSGSTDASTSSP